MIHRDIKGANILIAITNGLAKLADFGVSTDIHSQNDSDEEIAVGTPYWSLF